MGPMHDDQAREGGYTRELAGESAGADAHLVCPILYLCSGVYLGCVSNV
jgi:hypothetical protein